MNNTLRIILIASIVVVLSLALFFGGMLFGQYRYGYNMMNGFTPNGMMGRYSNSYDNNVPNSYGPGMMRRSEHRFRTAACNRPARSGESSCRCSRSARRGARCRC